MNRKSLLIVLTLAVVVMAAACSGPSPKIAITTAPPSSLEINNSASIAATTVHDSGEGVDWSCTPSPCGTFNPAHTASGATTVYTAPSTSGAVTITAASTKKSTVTATASVTISPIATTASLTGTYTYYANGVDSHGDAYSVAGSVTFDGSGNVTGGEQDYFDTFTNDIFTADPLIAGTATVTVGDDGRGTVTLTPTSAPVETLSIVVVNNNHALIEEFDATATSQGALDLQTSASTIAAGGYAFAFQDAEDSFVFGGVVTSTGTAFSTGEADDEQTGLSNLDFDPSTGSSITAADASGRGTMVLYDATIFGPVTFAYYVVGPEAFRVIEIDNQADLAGSMFGQGSGAGAYSASSLNGSFVFGLTGETDLGLGNYTAAGEFTGDGTGDLTAGVADANLGEGTAVLAGSMATNGTSYFVDADGYAGVTLGTALDTVTTPTLQNFGVYMVDSALNINDPNNASGGGGALMLNFDGNSLGTGFIVPQASGGSFSGNFAIGNEGLYDAGSGREFFDFVGQIVSDGVSSFSGLGDYNDLFNTGQDAGVTISGTFAADSNNPGRSTSQVTINGSNTPDTVTVYSASSSLAVFVDVDTPAAEEGVISLGFTEQQQ